MERTDIISEGPVARLGCEPSALQEENEALRTEILQPRKHLAQTAAVPLPPEILLSIFNRSIPPYFLLDSSLFPGPNSQWCKALRLKKTIISVCRAWLSAGISFLYEAVSIRRLDQLFCLLRTVKRSKSLARHIKVLHIHCFIPPNPNIASEFQNALRMLLELSPRLTTFGYYSRRGLCLPSPFGRRSPLHSSITHLHLDASIDYENILAQVGASLLSLRIQPNFIANDDHPSWYTTEVTLLSLESLALTITALHKSPYNIDIVGDHWRMPALRHLTIMHIYSTDHPLPADRLAMLSVSSFIHRHGSHLKVLHIRFAFDHKAFKELLASCPLLERLIVSPDIDRVEKWPRDYADDPPLHPNLTWLDVWSSDARPISAKVAELSYSQHWELRKNVFPSLRGVRMMYGMLDISHEVLVNFPPGSVQDESESFAVDVFQKRLEHKVGFVSWDHDGPSWEKDVTGHGSSYYSKTESDNSDSDELVEESELSSYISEEDRDSDDGSDGRLEDNEDAGVDLLQERVRSLMESLGA